MRLKCEAFTLQSVPVPFRIVNPANADPYLSHEGELEELLRTYRSVVGALEIAADRLQEAYDLPGLQTYRASVVPQQSAVRVTVTAEYAGKAGE